MQLGIPDNPHLVDVAGHPLVRRPNVHVDDAVVGNEDALVRMEQIEFHVLDKRDGLPHAPELHERAKVKFARENIQVEVIGFYHEEGRSMVEARVDPNLPVADAVFLGCGSKSTHGAGCRCRRSLTWRDWKSSSWRPPNRPSSMSPSRSRF